MNSYDPHGDDDLQVPPNSQGGGAPEAADEVDHASELIRQKLNRIYAEEPEATHELAEAAARAGNGRSKHQQFMYDLGTSGKDLATIQTEWHQYYESLPDKEKHAVWHEFYASQSALTQPARTAGGRSASQPQKLAKLKNQAAGRSRPATTVGGRSAKDIQQAIRNKVSAGGKLQARHHLQSLLFGLGMGLIVILIFLFGFFNEVIIAPFIQPSRAAADTPIILNNNGVAPTATPEVIIPKINVQIPVDYNETSTDENAIENDLENGVVHYPNTALPGQVGNAAFFGHSSNNIFNKGKYKFAFVLLHTLQQGDTFYLTYNGKVYVYKVISMTIVDPSDVGVLNAVAGQTATATLITCDPPGTSLHRLVVVGQQISPDPSTNAAATPTATTDSTPTALAGNGPTLWSRFIGSAAGKVIVVLIVGGGALWTIRRLNEPLIVR
ncbi:MAG TPA: class E sortase [Candidatus Saccharimonadales bacterium]|nr:class E sortase [Candidatus Saccharimonadales bacterium]